MSEQVPIFQLRETIALDNGMVRQIFDVQNFPGLVAVYDLSDVGNAGELEPVEQHYEIPSWGRTYDDLADAMSAWDEARGDHKVVEALGEALLRYQHGLKRPLWAERTPAQRAHWIAAARGFRRLLNNIGFDIVRLQKVPS